MVRQGEDGRPEVVIVDEFTGRMMPGRRWSDGLHQAVEAKEGIPVRSENQTLASITFQNFFRMYGKLGGMTGTADTEAPEFAKIYDLDVTIVPTHRPMIRKDLQDVVFKTKREKFDAVVDDIKERHAAGQPVLVGTISIETSEMLARKLGKHGVPHNVLNAKHHEREAEIVAQAGRKGAVTISTNMAGRGTDICARRQPRDARAREVRRRPEPPRVRRDVRALRGPVRARSAARWSRRAACTSSAPSGTRAGASTTSCAAAPAARATRARASSSCRSRTTCCASSRPTA